MKIFTVLISLVYLQGCTLQVIDKARGIEKTELPQSTIDSFSIDDKTQEYILCLTNNSDSKKHQIPKFSLKIPKNLI